MSGSLSELGEEYEDLRAEIGDIEAQLERLPALRERLSEVAVLIKQIVSDPRPVDLAPLPDEEESTETLTDGVQVAPHIETPEQLREEIDRAIPTETPFNGAFERSAPETD